MRDRYKQRVVRYISRQTVDGDRLTVSVYALCCAFFSLGFLTSTEGHLMCCRDVLCSGISGPTHEELETVTTKCPRHAKKRCQMHNHPQLRTPFSSLMEITVTDLRRL